MAETELVLSAISGAKLMDLEFMPQEFVVRGLLPKGLSILGGAPKIGKSWLMLELALRVAKGEPMWGMETKQGTVLYYCLEDTLKRIQQRLYCITENGRTTCCLKQPPAHWQRLWKKNFCSSLLNSLLQNFNPQRRIVRGFPQSTAVFETVSSFSAV